ncbi:MAG TPA: LptF/LptG family permease [Pyrinomonadaceae bacterium]|nr:LptF/LptG family permease [Pyrinomonadaceae bacterium]
MKRVGSLISRYLMTSIIPYFVSSWLLLSVILFVQQGSRYADIFFSVNVPANLIWQLAIALIPNVIAFTCPVAMLVGTIIGLTKMQGDSELIAIRAAGVGGIQIALPIAVLGILMSAFAFIVNLYGVPLAAALVRNVALETAIRKLESPIEPGAFNSEVAGYTIYVKEGDLETGRWKNLFVYSEDQSAKTLRLITSRSGRIDTSGEVSELVLENASVSTLPMAPGAGKYVAENIGDVRFAIRTRRAELIEKLSSSELTPAELGLQQLSEYAATKQGPERVEANILWQRRVVLSVTPLIFALLGTVIVLRFNRGGRGFGIFAALCVAIGYYVLAFLGEQLARVGTADVVVTSLIPIAGSILAIFWFSYSTRIRFLGRVTDLLRDVFRSLRPDPKRLQTGNLFVDLTTGLRDFDIVRNLIKNFVLTLSFLTTIFAVFTAFDLWRFASVIEGGTLLLAKYLFYLLPFIYLQIAPSAAMIATLATYSIKSRQNEIVTWTSAGQSVYRLLLPCLLLTLVLGGANWLVQEYVLPRGNRLQDEARSLIRNQGVPANLSGRYWVASENRIYSFTLASDNEKRACFPVCIDDLTAFEFAPNGVNLQSVFRSDRAVWESGRVRFLAPTEKRDLSAGKIAYSIVNGAELAEPLNPFAELRTKPSHLNSAELKRQIPAAESDVEQRNLAVAYEKKYTTLFLPFVMALFTAPFSLSLSRKGKAATVGYAVGLWLLFTGTGGVFEQMGLSGMLEAQLAVWSPLVIFSLLGIFLMSKVRT